MLRYKIDRMNHCAAKNILQLYLQRSPRPIVSASKRNQKETNVSFCCLVARVPNFLNFHGRDAFWLRFRVQGPHRAIRSGHHYSVFKHLTRRLTWRVKATCRKRSTSKVVVVDAWSNPSGSQGLWYSSWLPGLGDLEAWKNINQSIHDLDFWCNRTSCVNAARIVDMP